MSNEIELPKNWVCDGRELKPKTGANSSNTWLFDGKEIKPKTGASNSNTWVWDGKELKPKTSSSPSNTWIIDGEKVKPKAGANSTNTYYIRRHPILVVTAQLALRLWQKAIDLAVNVIGYVGVGVAIELSVYQRKSRCKGLYALKHA